MLAGDHGAKAAQMCIGQLNNFKCLSSFQEKERETTEQQQEKKKWRNSRSSLMLHSLAYLWGCNRLVMGHNFYLIPNSGIAALQ